MKAPGLSVVIPSPAGPAAGGPAGSLSRQTDAFRTDRRRVQPGALGIARHVRLATEASCRGYWSDLPSVESPGRSRRVAALREVLHRVPDFECCRSSRVHHHRAAGGRGRTQERSSRRRKHLLRRRVCTSCGMGGDRCRSLCPGDSAAAPIERLQLKRTRALGQSQRPSARGTGLTRPPPAG